MPPASERKKSAAAQNFVPVKEVRGGVMVLKNNIYVGVLLASSVNFALKSADEQQGTILQFQNFLNSIDFPIQIFIQSRKLDIRPYIATLEDRLKAQTDDLMKIQIREYISFVKTLVEQTNIMSKRFFVVVTYSPPILNINKEVTSRILGAGDLATKKGKEIGFDEHRSQLEQRISVVSSGLSGAGVRSVQLGTEEIVELLHRQFNPGELERPIMQTQQNAPQAEEKK